MARSLIGLLLALTVIHGVAIAQPIGDPHGLSVNQPAQGKEDKAAKPVPARPPEDEKTTAPDYKADCDSPKSEGAADLCEQRRMADASEDLVTLTDTQIFWTRVEVAALIVSIGFTAFAAWAAAVAAKAAQNAVNTERAWITFERGLVGVDAEQMHIGVRWKNTGRSPAVNLEVSFATRHRPKSDQLEEVKWVPIPEEKKQRGVAGSGEGFNTGMEAYPLDQIRRIYEDHALYIYSIVHYDDVFGQPHISELTYRCDPRKTFANLLATGGQDAFLFHPVGKQNRIT